MLLGLFCIHCEEKISTGWSAVIRDNRPCRRSRRWEQHYGAFADRNARLVSREAGLKRDRAHAQTVRRLLWASTMRTIKRRKGIW